MYFLLLLSAVSASAQVSRQEVWNRLSPEAKIMGLGESSHGFESFNAQKAEWLAGFQRENPDRAVIFESSFTLAALAWLEGDSARRTDRFLYPFWNTASVKNALRGFLSAERQQHVPKIFGCDIQEDCRFTALSEYLLDRHIVLLFADRLRQSDSILACCLGEQPVLSVLPLADAGRLQQNYRAVGDELAAHTGLPELHYRLLDRALQNRRWLCRYLTIKSTSDRMAYRDSLMAENVTWIYDTFLKNGEAVLWAANTHVVKSTAKKNKPAWMGEYLQARYGTRYAAVSLLPGKGETAVIVSQKGFDVSVEIPKPVKIAAEEWKTECLKIEK